MDRQARQRTGQSGQLADPATAEHFSKEPVQRNFDRIRPNKRLATNANNRRAASALYSTRIACVAWQTLSRVALICTKTGTLHRGPVRPLVHIGAWFRHIVPHSAYPPRPLPGHTVSFQYADGHQAHPYKNRASIPCRFCSISAKAAGLVLC